MPTYAVLGATGNTGTEIVKLLAKDATNTLHLYARSEAKLHGIFPFLKEQNSQHTIFTGDVNDVDLITRCIDGADAVFGVVGTNFNNPDLRIAQSLAEVIIASLTRLRNSARSGKEFTSPIVVFLTSAGMASNKDVHANFPNFLHAFLQIIGKYIYLDFTKATALFRDSENSWIPVVFMCSPGIMPGPSQGPFTIGDKIPKKAPLYVTYADLAGGMVQAAEEKELWSHKEIGIAGAKMPPIDQKINMYFFITNIMATYTPSLWRIGYKRNWWGHR